MKFSPSIIVKLLIALSLILTGTEAESQAREDELVFAFRGHGNTRAERMIVVGEVVSIEKAEILESDAIYDLDLDTRPDNVVVKLLNPKGVRVGQTLYLIEKDPNHRKYRNGNVVGEITVKSIFDTTFFGKQLRGEGFTRLIENRPMTVVRLQESLNTEDALILKKKGDALSHNGEIALAMKEYLNSIALDPNLPDPHYALGKLTLKEDKQRYITALSEYSLAWKYKENFSGIRERFEFNVSYLQLLKSHSQDPETNITLIRKNLNRMEEICLDSEKILGKRFETSLYQAWIFYTKFKMAKPNDKSRYQYFETSKLKLQEVTKFSRESLFYHETAILILEEELDGWVKGRPVPDKVISAMESLRKHGRRYLLINPPGEQIPIQIVEALERIE
jgi:tetratricopeptide (TPR) repeat protein